SVNVDLPRLEDVLGHGRYSLRAVDLERLSPAHDPRRKDKVGVTDRVIGMHVGEECRLDVHTAKTESTHSLFECSSRPPHDTGPEVDQVRRLVDYDSGRWSGAVRIGPRRSGAEHDHARCFIRAHRKSLKDACRQPRRLSPKPPGPL